MNTEIKLIDLVRHITRAVKAEEGIIGDTSAPLACQLIEEACKGFFVLRGYLRPDMIQTMRNRGFEVTVIRHSKDLSYELCEITWAEENSPETKESEPEEAKR